jgi:hypothetical protein
LILAHLQPLPLLFLSHDGVYTELGYFSWVIQRDFLLMQLFSVLFFAFFIPVSALIADRIGRRKCLFMPQRPSLFFGFAFSFLEFRQSSSGDFVLMYRNGFDGFTYGPLGTFLFRTNSLLFRNFFGI